MQTHALVAIVTFLALLLYFYMGLRVGMARGKYGVEAPAVSGNPDFERAYRIQMNTLEWLPIFLASMWLFALYWNDRVAAGVGLVWVIGRILYLTGYTKAAKDRELGFTVQSLATAVLLLGALGKAIWIAIQHGV
ncbi:MAG: MAPEG family protein [Caulobacterales bacterium]